MESFETIKILLDSYSKERGTNFTVEDLINSHRRIVDELNFGKRKEWNDALSEAKKDAYDSVIDSNYININDLAKMKLSEITELIS